MLSPYLSTPSAVEDSFSVIQIDSPYQSIEIRRHPTYGHLLVIDGDLQIAESDCAYGRAMVSPLLTTDQIGRVVIMGGGDGGVLQELLKTADAIGWPLMDATLVDIDLKVIQLSNEYLPRLNAGTFNDRRTNLHVEDALAYIKQQRNQDAVIYDLTMASVRPGQSRREFIAQTLADIADSLRPGGILSMQCCGETEIDPVLGINNQKFLEEIRFYVDHNFIDCQLQQVAIPSYHEQWTFLSARKPG